MPNVQRQAIMPIYEYRCEECNNQIDIFKGFEDSAVSEQCFRCNKPMRKLISIPHITGTRDGFGLREWTDERTGQRVDNWKSWEKAGYRDPMDSPTIKHKDVVKAKKKAIKDGKSKSLHLEDL